MAVSSSTFVFSLSPFLQPAYEYKEFRGEKRFVGRKIPMNPSKREFYPSFTLKDSIWINHQICPSAISFFNPFAIRLLILLPSVPGFHPWICQMIALMVNLNNNLLGEHICSCFRKTRTRQINMHDDSHKVCACEKTCS